MGRNHSRDISISMEKKSRNIIYRIYYVKTADYINDIFGDNEERIWAITSQGISYYEYGSKIPCKFFCDIMSR